MNRPHEFGESELRALDQWCRGWRLVLALLTLLFLLASVVHAESPKPKTPRLPGIALILDDADALLLKFAFTITATGGPDSVVTTVTFTGQPNVRRVYLVPNRTDTLSFPRGAQGDTVTATVVATAWKGADSSKASAVGKTGYRIPLVPAPTVAGLKIFPANWILQGGQTAPVCVFAVLTNGVKAKTRQSANSPGCDALYRAWRAT